jgi:hypothetical protein
MEDETMHDREKVKANEARNPNAEKVNRCNRIDIATIAGLG